MRVALPSIVAMMAFGSLVGIQDQTPTPSCKFAISGTADAAPTVLGDEDLISRFKAVPQPNSPVQIEEVDLRKFRVLVAGSSYRQEAGVYGVRFRNRSDAVITEVRGSVNVMIGLPGNSTGAAWVWRGTLMPDNTVEIMQRSGGGAGTASEGDVFVTATIDSVKSSACTYLRPRMR